MTRIAPLAWLAATLGAAAAQAQTFKKAPGAEQDDGNSPFNFTVDPGFEGDAGLWFDTAKEFLVNYYGYFGVAFIVLVLFLFGRGSKGDPVTGRAEHREAARAGGDGGGRRRRRAATTGEEDYYDIEGLDDLLEEEMR